MKCLLDYEFSKFGCEKCGAKLFCIIRKKYIKQMETKEMETKFEENTIVRCIAKGLSKFTKGNLYRIISKDFEHSKGYVYGIVDGAGIIEYLTEEIVEENFTDKNVPNEITYFSNGNKPKDNVNHPSHYTWLKDLCGVEPIDICRHLDFNLGNTLKYILRAGHKKDISMTEREKTIEDLKKAIFYINDKIEMLESKLPTN